MKKILLGMVIGIALTVSTSIYAEEIESLVGEVVEGTFPLLIDGTRAEKDVLVIRGTGYIPVRAASDLFGYDVLFNSEGQVVLTKKEGAEPVLSEEERQKQIEHKEKSLRFRELTVEITDLTDKIGELYPVIEPYEMIHQLPDGTFGTKEKDDVYYENKKIRDGYIEQRAKLQKEWDEISEYIKKRNAENLKKERAKLEAEKAAQ